MSAFLPRHRRADALLSVMVFVWGMHFIVLKDAFDDMPALIFNALRFLVGLPLMVVLAVRGKWWHPLPPVAMWPHIVLSVVIGPLLFQLGLVMGLDRTTSTNTAILLATAPAWTAVISLALGLVRADRALLIGLGMALGGVVLVVLSRAGSDLSLAHGDVIGSLFILGAALTNATSSLISKPLVDKLGAMRLASMKYAMNVLGLTLIALPGMIDLGALNVPLASVPALLFSGIISGVGGFVAIHYGLEQIGPTRTMSYFNFTPVVAAAAGVLILSEPFNLVLLLGAGLTLWGVITVRRHLFAPGTPVNPPTAGSASISAPPSASLADSEPDSVTDTSASIARSIR